MAREVLHLEHSMPGRARLRMPRPRTPAEVRAAGSELGGTRHIQEVEVNDRTGSILVRFDPQDPLDAVLEDLRGLGFLVEVAEHLPGVRELEHSEGAKVVQLTFGRANARLADMTAGKADLKLALPALFAALAVRQFIRDAGRIRNASWYQLAYWAFDSFTKLHRDGLRDGR